MDVSLWDGKGSMATFDCDWGTDQLWYFESEDLTNLVNGWELKGCSDH